MKRLFTTLFSLTLLLESSYCITINSNGNGDWSNSSSWQELQVPADGDSIIVNVGDTIYVDCNCGVFSNMYIEVHGLLYFNGGDKINLDQNGYILISASGKISGSNGGSKIILDGNEKWNGNDGDIIGPSFIDNFSNTATPLPIELIEFKGVETNSGIQLIWSTASEKNNDYFTIEHSLDGINWNEVAFVYGSGNSTSTLSYNYIDTKHSNGLNYYRLKQTDYDGTYEYKGIVTVLVKGFIKQSLYPNPTKDISLIKSNSIIESIELYTLDGRKVSLDYTLNGSEALLNIKSLAQGEYIVVSRSSMNLVNFRLKKE